MSDRRTEWSIRKLAEKWRSGSDQCAWENKPYCRCGLAPGLLGAASYLAAFIVMRVNSRNSDKDRESRWHPAIPMFIAATGLLGPLSQPRSIPLSVVVLLHGVSVPSVAPDILGNPDGILSQAAAAAAVGMIDVLAV